MSILTDSTLVTVVNLVAILLMIICVVYVFRLRVRVAGGVIHRKLRYLTFLVFLFMVGYLVPPFLGLLPAEVRPLLVACFSIFGAFYVLVSIKLVDDIITVLNE